MVKVELTDTEVEICTVIGQIRHLKTSAVCNEQKQSDLDAMQISIDGVLSEYIVAKHKGWFFDLNCDVRKFGADLIAPTGHKLDVKSTRLKNGNMTVRYNHNKKDYDFYVLVELTEENNGLIIGIAPRSVVIDEENTMVSKATGQPYYLVPKTKLKDFKK